MRTEVIKRACGTETAATCARFGDVTFRDRAVELGLVGAWMENIRASIVTRSA
jgi:hypothetical protein